MVMANSSQGFMSQFETYTGLWLIIPQGEEDEDEARRREDKEIGGGEEIGGSSSNNKVSGMRTKRQCER